MSHSRYKNFYTDYGSEKKSKQKVNRKFRRVSKLRMKLGEEPLQNLNETYNRYNFNDDGHHQYLSSEWVNKRHDKHKYLYK